ncbi:hypothetical protein D3C76_1566550 [compost metagenome]
MAVVGIWFSTVRGLVLLPVSPLVSVASRVINQLGDTAFLPSPLSIILKDGCCALDSQLVYGGFIMLQL